MVTGFDDNSKNESDYSQVVNLHSPKQCSNLPPFPLKLRGATGGTLNGSSIICGGYGRGNGSNIRRKIGCMGPIFHLDVLWIEKIGIKV